MAMESAGRVGFQHELIAELTMSLGEGRGHGFAELNARREVFAEPLVQVLESKFGAAFVSGTSA